MRVARQSSIEEYACWYLRRDRRKHPALSIADDAGDPVETMRRKHSGKMRDWFSASTRWDIVLLDTVGDLGNLVFLECDWTTAERLVIHDGPNHRLLSRVATNAISGNYFERPSAWKHRGYYDELANGSLRIEGENRVAICSAEGSEVRSNPAAQYYLLDGVGRCLPYMALLTQHLREFAPIEAFR